MVDINVGQIAEALNEKMDRNLVNADTIGQAILDKKVEVEALLEQNGYAKFTWKNGNKISKLIVQFGYNSSAWIHSNTVTITLPIAFANTTSYYINMAPTQGDQQMNVNRLTASTFRKSGNVGSDCYLAIGY